MDANFRMDLALKGIDYVQIVQRHQQFVRVDKNIDALDFEKKVFKIRSIKKSINNKSHAVCLSLASSVILSLRFTLAHSFTAQSILRHISVEFVFFSYGMPYIIVIGSGKCRSL